MSTIKTTPLSPKVLMAHSRLSKTSQSVKFQAPSLAHDYQISVVVLSKDEPEVAVSLKLLRPQCKALEAENIVVDASEGRIDYIHQALACTNWIDFNGSFWRSSTIPDQRNAGCRAAEGGSGTEREALGFAAREFALDIDWRANNNETALVYAQAIHGN